MEAFTTAARRTVYSIDTCGTVRRVRGGREALLLILSAILGRRRS